MPMPLASPAGAATPPSSTGTPEVRTVVMPTPQDPRWWEAVANRNVDRVQALLDEGADPNQRNSPMQETALDRLVRSTGSPAAARTVEQLLRAGANPFLQAQAGFPSPFEAILRETRRKTCWQAHASAELARAMVQLVDPVHLGVVSLGQDAPPAASPASPDTSPRARAARAVLLAVQFAPDLVVPLLDRGAPMHGEGSVSVLAEALGRGPVSLVTALLDRGATLSVADQASGQDAITLVTRGGGRTDDTPATLNERRMALVNLLHERGHRMAGTARDRVLGKAVENRCEPAFLHRLVELGANPNGTTRHGLTALHIAVDSPAGYPYVALLLEMGLNPCAISRSGQTPIERLLAWAQRETSVRPVLALLEAPALRATLNETSPSHPPATALPRRRL